MRKHMHHFLFPENFSHFFMYSLVSKNSQLVIPHGNINQYSVVSGCFTHIELNKYLGRTVQRINKTATAFYINPDFSAGLLLRFLDGSDDPVLF